MVGWWGGGVAGWQGATPCLLAAIITLVLLMLPRGLFQVPSSPLLLLRWGKAVSTALVRLQWYLVLEPDRCWLFRLFLEHNSVLY